MLDVINSLNVHVEPYEICEFTHTHIKRIKTEIHVYIASKSDVKYS